jgi:hypothetical protein
VCKRSKTVVSTVGKKRVDIKEDPKVDMGMFMEKNMVEEEVDPPHVSIVVKLVMSHSFVLICVYFAPIVIVKV